jgi:hypothetical protein
MHHYARHDRPLPSLLLAQRSTYPEETFVSASLQFGEGELALAGCIIIAACTPLKKRPLAAKVAESFVAA